MNNDLIDLREKYLRMRALRAARPHAEPDRQELRELSRRWPGALAEIDCLPPEVLEDRIAALDAAIAGGDTPLFARAWLLTHRRLRGALAIKAWLGGRRDVAPREPLPHDLPIEARVYETRVDEIARPPNGKLTELVFADVARELSLPVEHMRALLMPRGLH